MQKLEATPSCIAPGISMQPTYAQAKGMTLQAFQCRDATRDLGPDLIPLPNHVSVELWSDERLGILQVSTVPSLAWSVRWLPGGDARHIVLLRC